MTRRKAILMGAVVAVIAAAAVVATLRASPAALDRARPGRAEPGPDGVPTIDLLVAGGEYTPNVLQARADQPLRLRVLVRERHGCATRLLVPDLHVDLALLPGVQAETLLPAGAPGSHVFTCGQKMVKGVIVRE